MPTAILAAGTGSQQVTGIREDLTDILTNISPTETPFLSSIGRTNASNVLHEWQTIALETVASAGGNAIAEGASATPASGNVATRVQNYTQIFTKTVRVSNTVLNVNTAGRANEWELQMDIKAKSLARDIEAMLMQSSAFSAGDVSADTGRMLEGLGVGCSVGFLSGNIESLLTAASDTATRKNLSETTFNNMLQTIWTAGGNPDTVHAGGYLRRVISSFSANATRYSSVDFGDTILNASVSVYQSDFGQVKIVTNRYCTLAGGHGAPLAAIETQYFKLAELRPLTFSKLAKDGDRELGQFVIEATLAAYAPTSSGQLYGAASAAGATT
jgi:hypothetical protein